MVCLFLQSILLVFHKCLFYFDNTFIQGSKWPRLKKAAFFPHSLQAVAKTRDVKTPSPCLYWNRCGKYLLVVLIETLKKHCKCGEQPPVH